MNEMNETIVKLNKNTGRNAALDAVKGFAILLVMLGHCIVLNGLADAYFYDAIAAVQMPLFMAVSGYIAGWKRPETVEKPDITKRIRILEKRSISYLVPFFSWMVIVSFPHCLQELKTELFHLDYGLWFLATLWIVNLVCMIASYAADLVRYRYCGKKQMLMKSDNIQTTGRTDVLTTQKADPLVNIQIHDAERKQEQKQEQKYMDKGMWLHFLTFILIVLCCYAGFFLQARSGNTFLSPSLTVRYLPFYVAGYLVSYHVLPFLTRKETGHHRGQTGFINVIWLLCLAAFIYLVCAFDMVVVTDTQTLVVQMTASFLGVFVCFYGVARFSRGHLQKVLAFVGQYTLEIYVLHFRFARVLHLSEKNLTPFHADTILWIIAAFIVMSILTAVFISALKQLWITDFLCFGKVRPRRKRKTSSTIEKR